MAESSQQGSTVPDSDGKHKLYKQLLRKMSKVRKPVQIIVPDREPWPPPPKNVARPHVRRNRTSDLRTKRPLMPPPVGVLDFNATHRDICHRGFVQREFPPSVGALPRKQRQKVIVPTLLPPLTLKRPQVGLPKVLSEGLKKLANSKEPSTHGQGTHPRTEPGRSQTPSLPNYSLLYEISRHVDSRTLCEIANEAESMSYKDRILKKLWGATNPTSRNSEPNSEFSSHLVIFSTLVVIGILKEIHSFINIFLTHQCGVSLVGDIHFHLQLKLLLK